LTTRLVLGCWALFGIVLLATETFARVGGGQSYGGGGGSGGGGAAVGRSFTWSFACCFG